MNNPKPFSQSLHDLCDIPSRQAVIDYAKEFWGVDVKPNPDKYAVDLIVYRNDIATGYIEVEMRDWRQPNETECPYESIHVPYRKEKLFKNNLPTIYFIVHCDRLFGYWMRVEKIMKYPIKVIKNNSVSDGEKFYDVPKKFWNFVKMPVVALHQFDAVQQEKHWLDD